MQSGNQVVIRISKLIVIFSLSAILSACALLGSEKQKVPEPYETQDFFMGTIIHQKIFGENADEAAEAVRKRLVDIESKMTINKPGGEINQLNEMAGTGAVSVSSDTAYVLSKACTYAEMSGGAFDPTIGPLVKAWDIMGNPRIPPQGEIDSLLKLVDYKSIELDVKNLKVKLGVKGQMVDLGAIAKGYSGDEAIRIYKKYGIRSAYISLGGNVMALGAKPDGSAWRIGIQNPRAVNGSYVGIVEVKDKAIVTSGDYERYFEEDSVRYHHILDSRTGYPARSGLISTTIIADFSIDADALSTSTFVLGLEKGMELVERLDGVEAVFITEDKKIYLTEGLKGNFSLADESKEYAYGQKG